MLIYGRRIDDIGIQVILVVKIIKAVRHDLHDALLGRNEPQIVLVIGHDVFDRSRHRQILKRDQSSVYDTGDAVIRTYPDLFIKLTDRVDICERFDGIDDL